MSTPNPPKLKLEVLNLDAQRRARGQAPDESMGTPPWMRRHRQDGEQQEAGQTAERSIPATPGSIQAAQERLDESIRRAIETASEDNEEEADDDGEAEADDVEGGGADVEAEGDDVEAEGGDTEPEADDGGLRLPPAPGLRAPLGGAADRRSAAADVSGPDHDMARAQARRRRRLEPEIVPEPPLAESRMAPLLLRFVVVVGLAAIAAFAVTMIGPLETHFLSPAPTTDNSAAITADNSPAGTADNVAATAPVAQDRPAIERPPPALEKSAWLVVENKQSFTNEPVELGISVDGGTGHESLLLAGLIAGTRLSAGAPIGETRWELALNDLRNVQIYAPKDFVGVMNAAVDLLSPTAQLLDTKTVQFAWVAKPIAPPVARITPEQKAAPVQPRDLEQEAIMLKRGEDLLDIGDIAGARRVFQYLADAGNANGALAMGATFDARFLAAHNAIGVAADDAKARNWYRRAADLGSAQAKTLLAQMTDQ